MPLSNPLSLTQDALKQRLTYDPLTGLFGRVCPAMVDYHGEQVGGLTANGYRLVTVYGSRFYAHRLAFLYMLGRWPIGEVDHINGSPDDNRWENLREATHQQNGRNVKTPKDNTSGVKGVYWARERQKWAAQITVNRKTIHLGRFKTIEEAKAARENRERELFGEFARLGSIT